MYLHISMHFSFGDHCCQEVWSMISFQCIFKTYIGHNYLFFIYKYWTQLSYPLDIEKDLTSPLSLIETGRLSKASITFEEILWEEILHIDVKQCHFSHIYLIQYKVVTCKTSAAALTRSLFHNFSMSTVKWNVFGLMNMDLSIPKSAECNMQQCLLEEEEDERK